MKNECLSEIQIACIMYQILLAINHIHKLQIMHRDLKLENILVSKKEENGLYRIKICDFGTSHLFKDGEKEKNITGSAYYIAPEVLKHKYDFKCDLWSCGVIMYVLLTKKVPFAGKDLREMRNNIIKKVRILNYQNPYFFISL
jgi:calcium-dependent protein kinase